MSGGRLIPVLNAGSSSLNFAPHLEARVSKGVKLTAKRWPAGAPEEFAEVLDRREDSLFAVGCLVVHGGKRHVAPARLMAESLIALEAPTLLDPLHPPRTLTPMRAVLVAWLALPQVDVRIIAADKQEMTAPHIEALPRGPAQ
jgi:acetate kinase